MAFIDNPTIAALGGALGLSPLFAAASGAGDGSPMSGDTPKPGVTKPNIPVYKERPYVPRNQGSGPSGGVTPGGSNPTTPGTMDPATLQSPQVAPLLAQYGVTPPTTPPDPNLFIHNPEAFNKHPVISGMLERGLEGLAFSHPGENFLQSLVGGVRGMGEANAARSEQVNAQVNAPLQQAQQIAALQHLGDVHNEAQSTMDYHKGLLAHYTAQDLTKQQRIAAMPPRFGKNGQPYYYKEDEDGNPGWEADKNWKEDPQTAMTRQFYESKKAELVDKYGSLEQVPPEEIDKAMQDFETHRSLGKGAASMHNADVRANATTTAAAIRGTGKGGNAPGSITPQQRAQLSEYNRQEASDQKIVSGIESGSSPTVKDENGKIVYSGSPAAQAYKQRVQARIAQRRQIKAKILGIPSTTDTPPQAPTFSPGNPFAPKPS
jgi:hypothetical protein